MLKNRNRILAGFSSLLIIFTMMFGIAGNAFADTAGGTEEADVNVGITNILRTKEKIDVPGAVFKYVYTKDGLVNFQNSGAAAIGRETFEDETQPDLTNTESQLQAKYKQFMTAYPNVVDNKKIYKIVGGNIIPDASKFKHAGVYQYTINQELANEGAFTEYLTCSQAEYKLFVYVENSDDGLVVSGATAYKVKDDTGNEIESPAKADLTKNTYAPSDGSDLMFVNDYNPDNVGLAITNLVSGKYADMTRSFKFELKMLNPADIAEEHTYKAVIVDEDSNLPISDELLSFTTDKVTGFELKNKERLTFVNDEYVIDKEKELTSEDTDFLPAGSSFVLVTKGTPAYTTRFVPTMGGTEYSMQIGNTGKDVTVKDNYLNLGTNKVDITQSYKSITVTGVVSKIMPALILLLFAICGIVLGGSSRRRNAAE